MKWSNWTTSRGLARNQAQLLTLFALGKLMLAGRCQGNADEPRVS